MLLTLTAGADDDGRRLDRILRKALRELPLSAIHRFLRQGSVRVNGEVAAADRRVQAGQTITVPQISPLTQPSVQSSAPGQNTALSPSLFRVEILFEGAGLLVLNKPAGLAVHGQESLEGWALSYLAPKLPASLSFRPGPLHRLDRPSSGVIVFSANLQGARVFSVMMRERRIKKFYLALVRGCIEREEFWQDELSRDRNLKKTFAAGRGAGGKIAITRIKPLARSFDGEEAGGRSGCTLVLAEIETGRSHQIRAQAAGRGHPLLYDKKYGGGGSGGFLLHAWRMEFPEDAALTGFPDFINAPLPDYFDAKIKKLFGKNVIPLEPEAYT